jgi:hypothetical protein
MTDALMNDGRGFSQPRFFANAALRARSFLARVIAGSGPPLRSQSSNGFNAHRVRHDASRSMSRHYPIGFILFLQSSTRGGEPSRQ